MQTKWLVFCQEFDRESILLGSFPHWFDNSKGDVKAVCLRGDESSAGVEVICVGKSFLGLPLWPFLMFWEALKSSIKTDEAETNVLFHMCPIYCLFCFPLIFKSQTTRYLWYCHPKVSIWLVISKLFNLIYVTASTTSFPIQSYKPKVIGHAVVVPICKIPTELSNTKLRIRSFGRISCKEALACWIDLPFSGKKISEFKFSRRNDRSKAK